MSDNNTVTGGVYPFNDPPFGPTSPGLLPWIVPPPPPFMPNPNIPFEPSPMTSIVILSEPNDYPKGTTVTFSMYRGTDESGISGEGKVLDGVIFEDGTVCVRWMTKNASQSTVIYDNGSREGEKPTTGFQKFLDIHVRAHPANNTVVEFHVPNAQIFRWTQPQGEFKIDQKQAEEAARYITWAVQQPWFKWPVQVEKEGND